MSDVTGHILVVDDTADAREVLQRTLAARGHVVRCASNVSEAVRLLESEAFDLVITDLRMPQVDGLSLIRHVRDNHADTAVVMVTGYSSIESAVTAVKDGAEDYLAKPFTDVELHEVVQRALSKISERRRLESGTVEASRFGLIGDSPAMQRVYRSIEKAATTDATALITGESGTGKELVARAVHYGGARAAAPFVPINCAAIPDGLVESELFGHVRGAFTGATTSRAGFFITADSGTIFLDEIGELAAATQAKLLRVLEDGKVRMVGASAERAVDVRVIAATHRNLAELAGRGAFREDLFFRLNIITIELPPLRERGRDVLTLVRHFAERLVLRGATVPRFSDAACAALQSYNWPGNVRELENLVQRLLVMVDDDEVQVSDLPPFMRYAAPRHENELRSLAAVESDHIRFVLDQCGGNKTRAAEILGIDRKTLREKLRDNADTKA